MIVERSFSFFFFIQHKLGYRNGGGEEGGGRRFCANQYEGGRKMADGKGDRNREKSW